MEPKRYIQCPELETLENVSFRHFAGEEDYQLMVDLFNATKDFNGFDWSVSVEDMQNEARWRKNYDIHEQLVFIESNGEPVGYFSYNWAIEDDDDLILNVGGSIKEEYFNTGIPQALVNFQERKLVEMTVDVPHKGKKLFSMWHKMKAAGQIDFYKKNGYDHTRYFFEMTRPIDKAIGEHPMPEGLEIRPVKPEHYRKVWKANNEAFKDHWGYSEPTEEQFEAWQKDRLFTPHLFKIAWEGDQVCGMVCNFFDDKENKEYNRLRGYTEDIAVRRQWRKLGLAKALIAESNRMFKEMGMTETALGVDAENPSGALKLYTDMGYEEQKDKTSTVLRKKAA